MTCRECDQFLADYLSGELAAEIRVAFEFHLTLCRNCVTYVEQYRTTIRAGRVAFMDDPRDEHADPPEELIRAILAARSGPGHGH